MGSERKNRLFTDSFPYGMGGGMHGSHRMSVSGE